VDHPLQRPADHAARDEVVPERHGGGDRGGRDRGDQRPELAVPGDPGRSEEDEQAAAHPGDPELERDPGEVAAELREADGEAGQRADGEGTGEDDRPRPRHRARPQEHAHADARREDEHQHHPRPQEAGHRERLVERCRGGEDHEPGDRRQEGDDADDDRPRGVERTRGRCGRPDQQPGRDEPQLQRDRDPRVAQRAADGIPQRAVQVEGAWRCGVGRQVARGRHRSQVRSITRRKPSP
jgi:hypothetical protein